MSHRVLAALASPLLAALLFGFLLTERAVARGQQSDAPIWGGVYTSAQAARGKTVYDAYCTRCHGLNLLGGRAGAGGGPALKDSDFWVNWERSSLNSLLSKIQGTMPRDSPSSLRNDDYTDVLAFILSENEFPPGSKELMASAALDDVVIVRRDAQQAEAPSFTLVGVVGCLTAGPDGTWRLTSSTAPVVTREEDVTPGALAQAKTRGLGTEQFRLIGVSRFDPASKQGQRVSARGLLNRVPNDNHIDVLSMQVVDPTCG